MSEIKSVFHDGKIKYEIQVKLGLTSGKMTILRMLL